MGNFRRVEVENLSKLNLRVFPIIRMMYVRVFRVVLLMVQLATLEVAEFSEVE